MPKLKFSVVIAIGPGRKAEVINSLKKLEYSGKYEVIVEKGRNPSNNRNKGAKKAKGDIIAFLDDDAIVKPDLLNKAEEFFNLHKNIAIVGGPQLTPEDDKGFAKISGYALACRFGAWKISNRYAGKKLILNADETMLTSANMFCRKEVFEKIMFNPLLYPGEDPDFISRAIKEGFKTAYNPELVVYHRRRRNVFGFIKQIYSYGKTRPIKEPLRATLKMPFFLIPSLFLIYLTLMIIISLVGGAGFLILFPLIGYIVLSLAFSLSHAIINKSITSFFVLPFVYLAIHLSYGYGFLISSIKNIFKKRN